MPLQSIRTTDLVGPCVLLPHESPPHPGSAGSSRPSQLTLPAMGTPPSGSQRDQRAQRCCRETPSPLLPLGVSRSKASCPTAAGSWGHVPLLGPPCTVPPRAVLTKMRFGGCRSRVGPGLQRALLGGRQRARSHRGLRRWQSHWDLDETQERTEKCGGMTSRGKRPPEHHVPVRKPGFPFPGSRKEGKHGALFRRVLHVPRAEATPLFMFTSRGTEPSA